MSFKDTFTKDDAKSSLLEYDDGAFYFFASTALLVTLVPWSWWYARKFWRSRGGSGVPRVTRSGAELTKCGCSLCEDKRRRNEEHSRSKFSLYSSATQKHTAGLALGWILFLYMAYRSMTVSMSSMAAFNPYEVLNIALDATEKQIKKAFRTMSLKYHPDKNRNDPSSAAKFVLISKAYHTLTDETARKNFEKYGNPDGAGMMKVGIGLPQFLIKENSQVFILIVFFILLLVIIPAAFISYYQKVREFAPSGLRIDTIRYFSCFIKDSSKPNQMLILIASSSECRNQNKTLKTDDEEIEELAKKVKMPPDNAAFKAVLGHPAVKKNMVLLYAHMQRLTSTLSTPNQAYLRQLLRSSLLMTKSMMDIAVFNNWHSTINVVLGLRKALLQAVDIDGLAILQLPHIDEAQGKKIIQAIQENKPKDFRTLLRQTLDKKDALLSHLTSGQVADFEAIWKHVPAIKMTINMEVQGETEIVVGDVGTCKISLERTHLGLKEGQGPIHAPFYPDTKFEEWFFFVSDRQTNQLCGFQTSKSVQRDFEIEIQFPIRNPGRRNLVIVALCDSYFGVDVMGSCEFEVLAEGKEDRQFFVHPEDAALDNQPTFLQQMVGGQGEEETDSSDDDE